MQSTSEKPSNVEITNNIVAEIPPEPFLNISLTKTKYHKGNIIKAKLSFFGLHIGETIWIGIFDPNKEEIVTKRLEVKESQGKVSINLTTIGNWDKGNYVVKTDTQFGPEASTRFELVK